jgi:hypothetical protein
LDFFRDFYGKFTGILNIETLLAERQILASDFRGSKCQGSWVLFGFFGFIDLESLVRV